MVSSRRCGSDDANKKWSRCEAFATSSQDGEPICLNLIDEPLLLLSIDEWKILFYKPIRGIEVQLDG